MKRPFGKCCVSLIPSSHIKSRSDVFQRHAFLSILIPNCRLPTSFNVSRNIDAGTPNGHPSRFPKMSDHRTHRYNCRILSSHPALLSDPALPLLLQDEISPHFSIRKCPTSSVGTMRVEAVNAAVFRPGDGMIGPAERRGLFSQVRGFSNRSDAIASEIAI
jgi:hypothetical protein